MVRTPPFILVFCALSPTVGVPAADSCLADVIATAAEVEVSDGSSFRVETYYRSANALAVRFIDDGESLFVVEGPSSWARVNGEESAGSDRPSGFALGHQYHALLSRYEQIAAGGLQEATVDYEGRSSAASKADYPYGGTLYLVNGDTPDEPVALLFEFPGTPRIESQLLDWRRGGDRRVPFYIRIDDGTRVFHYRYASIEFMRKPLRWFYSVVGSPELDAVRIYRASLADSCADDG